MTVNIFTDGSCSGNGKAGASGGYAAIMQYTASDGKLYEKVLVGHEPNSTNNRMELMAPIVALESLKSKCDVVIYSDSAYLIDTVVKDPSGNSRLKDWIRRGWRTKGKTAVANKELWQRLIEAAKAHTSTCYFVKVEGHSGNEMNERCDSLAKEQAVRNSEFHRNDIIVYSRNNDSHVYYDFGKTMTSVVSDFDTKEERLMVISDEDDMNRVRGTHMVISRIVPDTEAYAEACDKYLRYYPD